MTLGARLVDLRKKHGLSQDALAEALGVSRQSVSKWETDASVPDLDRLVKLSALFEISLDELVKGEKPQFEAAAPSGRKKLWAQTVKLYREKAYLLGWPLVIQGLLRANSFIKGVSMYYNGTNRAATVQFVQTALSGSLVMIFLTLLTGLLIVFLGRRFSGRFRWYHLGWIPVSAALFGLRFTSQLHTGLLDCLLMDLMLLLPLRGADYLLETLPSSLLGSIPQILLLIIGLAVVFAGSRKGHSR